MKRTASALSRNAKLLAAGGLAVGGYVLYKNMNAAQSAPGAPIDTSTVGGKVANATMVLKEHAIAAKDDIKKETAEIAAVVRHHSALASKDMSTATDEIRKSLSGEEISSVTVRDTPPTVTNELGDSIRKVPAPSFGGYEYNAPGKAKATIIPNKQVDGSRRLEGTSEGSEEFRERGVAPSIPAAGNPPRKAPASIPFHNDSTRSSTYESPSGPQGYEPATFSESPHERGHSTTYSNRSPSDSSSSWRAKTDDFKREVEDRTRGIKDNASREVEEWKATAKDLKRNVEDHARDFQDKASYDVENWKAKATDVKRDVEDRARSFGDEVSRSAETWKNKASESFRQVKEDASRGMDDWTGKTSNKKQVVTEHAKGAKEDVSQATSELGTVASTHAKVAANDVKQAGWEVKEALSGRVPDKAMVRDVPDLTNNAPEDRVKPQALDTPAAGKEKAGLGERLHAAKEVIAEHFRGAKDDMKQAKDEAGAVIEEHRAQASRDVDTAKAELKSVSNTGSTPDDKIRVRSTPSMIGSDMSKYASKSYQPSKSELQ